MGRDDLGWIRGVRRLKVCRFLLFCNFRLLRLPPLRLWGEPSFCFYLHGCLAGDFEPNLLVSLVFTSTKELVKFSNNTYGVCHVSMKDFKGIFNVLQAVILPHSCPHPLEWLSTEAHSTYSVVPVFPAETHVYPGISLFPSLMALSKRLIF